MLGRLRISGDIVQLAFELRSTRVAVTWGPESVKLKNLHCYKPLPENGW
jgi:hypothetical protein